MIWSTQDAFDMAMLYFHQQKSRCLNFYGNCTYINRRENNSRCVIGYMLPLNTLIEEPNLPNCSISRLIRESIVKHPGGKVSLQFLLSLQGLHDNDKCWDEKGFIGWGRLHQLALQYELDVSQHLSFFAEKINLRRKVEEKVLVGV